VLPGLLQAGGVTSYLQSSTRQYMLFAPDNIAWQSFFEGMFAERVGG
jgi:hypothetical protein